jgi:hypothetical protein
MADAVSLKRLIAAVTGAVTEAQDAIQQHQLGAIARYFDKSGRPFAFTFLLPNPSLDPNADPHRKVVVPLLSVLEPNLLAISEFTIDFRVELGSLGEVAPPEEPMEDGPVLAAAARVEPPERAGAPIDVPRPPPPVGPDGIAAAPVDEPAENVGDALPAIGPAPPPMTVGLATRSDSDGPVANLSIKVVSRPLADGLGRLIDALNKTI